MLLALGGPPPRLRWGPHVPYEQLWIHSPEGWFLSILVKILQCVFKKKMKQLLFTKGPPPQPVTLHRGPLGPPWEMPWTTFILHLTRYLFSFWIWKRWCLKFAWFWPFGEPPPGPPWGPHILFDNFESPTPKDDSCQVWLKSNHAFSRRRWKCKKFTDNARRTKTDGNSSPWAFGSGELKTIQN